MAKKINVPGRLHSVATGNILSGAVEIYDDITKKNQQVINKEVAERIDTLDNRSTQMETAINDISVTGGASTASAVSYSNSTSGLEAITTQGAIDELESKKFDKENIADDLTTDAATKVLSAKQGKKLFDLNMGYDVSVHNGGKSYTLAGTAQVVRLTITGAPTADGTITITFGGAAKAITISAATQNTAALVAAQVATGAFTGYTVRYTSGKAYVDFIASAVGKKAAPTIDFGTTGITGSISTTMAGADSAIAAVPAEFQRGGLTIAFVDAISGEYAKYFCNSSTWSNSIGGWIVADKFVMKAADTVLGINLYFSENFNVGLKLQKKYNVALSKGMTISYTVKAAGANNVYVVFGNDTRQVPVAKYGVAQDYVLTSDVQSVSIIINAADITTDGVVELSVTQQSLVDRLNEDEDALSSHALDINTLQIAQKKSDYGKTKSQRTIAQLCQIYKYYNVSGSTVTVNASTAWSSTDIIPVNIIDKVSIVSGETSLRPVVLFFSERSLTSYIGGLYAPTGTVLEFDPIKDSPKSAKYMIVQTQSKYVGSGYYTLTYRPTSNVQDYAVFATSGIWTEAIQLALDYSRKVNIPDIGQTYNLDDRLIIHSGQSLIADRTARFFLMDNVGTCFIRNENMFASTHDTDITIRGGIWDGNYAKNSGSYGNGGYCVSDKKSPVRGVSGMISMMGVDGLEISDITIRQARSFGVHITDCNRFHIHDVFFDDNKRDGIHCTGTCSNFHINDIKGLTKDDFVALNAWDWSYSTARFGQIKNGVVENLYEDVGDDNSIPTGDAVRFLCGEEEGVNYTCDNVVVRNVFCRNNNTSILISHQEDLENTAHVASSGKMGKIRLENLYIGSNTSPCILCAVDTESVSIRNFIPNGTNLAMKINTGITIDSMVIDGFVFKSPSGYNKAGQVTIAGDILMLSLNNVCYSRTDKVVDYTGFINLSGNLYHATLSNSSFDISDTVISANNDTAGTINIAIRNCKVSNASYVAIAKAGVYKIVENYFNKITSMIRNTGTNNIDAYDSMNTKVKVGSASTGNVTWG